MGKVIWTYEKCKEEVSKMTYLSELSGTSMLGSIRRNGWFDELTKNLIRKVSKPYTEEDCRLEALKYETRVSFQKMSSGVYNKASRLGIIDEICSHMGKPLNENQHTKEEVLTSALRYQNQRDWKKNESSIFYSASSYKDKDPEFWERCTSHMDYIFKPNGFWTYDMCREITLKYTTLTEFRKKEKKVYGAIKRHGWNDLLSHMNRISKNGKIVRSSKEFDTLEKCKKESLKYNSRSHMCEECNLLYKIILVNNWESECFSHMEIKATLTKRFIYSFEFVETNIVYVGLTCNVDRRIKQHYGIEKGKDGKIKSKVYDYMTESNLTPVFKLLTEEPVKERDAGSHEDKWIKFYENNGWELLNCVRAGSLGGRSVRDFEYFQKIKSECNSLTEFMSKTTPYDKTKLKRYGWWDKLIEGLDIDRVIWTIDKVYQEYPKYKTLRRSGLQKKAPGLYKAVVRLNLLDELFPLKKPLTYEDCMIVTSKYEYYSEFIDKEKKIYLLCKKNKWGDLTSHMKKNVKSRVGSKYTYEICENLVLSEKIENRSSFEKRYPGATKYLRRTGQLDKLFPKVKKVWGSKYTYEICLDLVKGCKNRSDFQKKYPGAFKFLSKNNLLDVIFPK